MFYFFGPKLDIVSKPYLTVLILLACSAVLFPRLLLLSLWGKIPANVLDAMLFFL